MSTDTTSPVQTRRRAKEAAAEPSTEAATLQEILAEMRRMKEEQARREEALTELLRQRDEELRKLRYQLSPSDNRATDFRESGDAERAEARRVPACEGGDVERAETRRVPACVSGDAERAETGRVPACVGVDVERVPASVSGDAERIPACVSGERAEFGLKLKPDTYDGSVPLREFLLQFDLVARANRWGDSFKAVALASSLRGKARSMLETVQDSEGLEYAELKSRLELRFGETHTAQSSYTRFANRRQRFGEDFATLGAELERLARFAYPECSFAVREKIACAQFISALSDGFVKRTLQLEGVSSLKAAIERARAVKDILGESREGGSPGFRKPDSEGRNPAVTGAKKFPADGGSKVEAKGREEGPRECWSCGKSGHFRAECPSKEEGGAR